MAFPRQLLADHEKIILDLRPHWVAVLPSVFWTIAILVAMFLGYWAVGSIGAIGDTVGKSIVGAIALIVWIFLALLRVLRWQFTMFVLTTDRLITRQGIIAKSSKEIPLESINDVAFNQSVIERLLGAGDLMIESAGTRGQNLISNVRHPEQVQLSIFKEIESNTARTFRPAPAEPTEDIPSQIEALARLKDQGAITGAEFETKKAELLKRL
ncbi:MAG TPA: PH domain-containing protein [Actinomycetota bacterium]|nr:PH domain-containing protein [Actinomycetota bacterium]